MYHNYHFVSDGVFGNQYTQPDPGYIEPLLEFFPGCVLGSIPGPKSGPIAKKWAHWILAAKDVDCLLGSAFSLTFQATAVTQVCFDHNGYCNL